MKVKVSNEIGIQGYSKELLDYCDTYLTVDNPQYFIAEKMGRYLGNIEKELILYEKRGDTLVVPFGTVAKIWPYISKADITYEFAPQKALTMEGSINLYDYQEKAVDVLVKAKHGILESPCGSGKTQIGVALIKKLGQKALWLTHTNDLLKQSMDRAKAYFDGDFGTITGGKVNIGKDITFSTVQTMVKLDLQKYADEWNVIIVDECHKVAGTPTRVMQFYKVVTNLKARHKYGLSATLHRADSLIKSTYAVLGNIVHSITDKEVSRFIMKASHQAIYTGLPESEDYLETDGTLKYTDLISYISNDDERNKLIIDTVNLEPNHYHLVLCHRTKQVDLLYEKAKEQGLNPLVFYGSLSKRQREFALRATRDGSCNLIIGVYAIAKEGLDIPNLDRLHLASPHKDKSIVKQSAGRIERRIDGKDEAIIYDYVDKNIGYCFKAYRKRVNILKKRT